MKKERTLSILVIISLVLSIVCLIVVFVPKNVISDLFTVPKPNTLYIDNVSSTYYGYDLSVFVVNPTDNIYRYYFVITIDKATLNESQYYQGRNHNYIHDSFPHSTTNTRIMELDYNGVQALIGKQIQLILCDTTEGQIFSGTFTIGQSTP